MRNFALTQNTASLQTCFGVFFGFLGGGFLNNLIFIFSLASIKLATNAFEIYQPLLFGGIFLTLKGGYAFAQFSDTIVVKH